MPFLVDTCVISELYKPAPDVNVRRVVESQRSEDLFVSVTTLAEIRRGLLILPQGRRRSELAAWAKRTEEWYADRIIGIDHQVARTWAERAAHARLRGRHFGLADGPIAATAICHGLTVLTRNTADFQQTGVALSNPWIASAN
ncbi:ribonuclease VapC [Aureimonas sp. SA4125]|uniref:type II toxin-antitoxin system VapC family toxin n=1 Tax=Aureimonas sp. SA4125 TaxID=2826993 RepID=UPI001CC3A1EB|nr:type II toxin-antitoxin system VapC family toxin [Aureimonas sp. SA4125]BDA82477.1 ribonuclease VapC [Aureimonas sp. SA4125]